MYDNTIMKLPALYVLFEFLLRVLLSKCDNIGKSDI